jgi:cytochrome c-type biogenesis protein
VVGGVLLLAVGLLLVTGVWDTLTAQLQSRLVSGFETVI